MILQSVITCPECGTAKSETMPIYACQFFYVCTGCGTKLRPKKGDYAMDLHLRGKSVLITGASKGIGAATAEAFAEALFARSSNRIAFQMSFSV
jgi:hypothetical protein